MDRPVVRLGDLDGPAGNAFVILGNCKRAAKQQDMDYDLYEKFRVQAMSADYDDLLDTVNEYFEVVD